MTVTSLSALQSAASGTDKKIVIISGTISGNTVVNVGSNKSIIGKKGSGEFCSLAMRRCKRVLTSCVIALNGVGLRVNKQSNVIIRNVKISKVLASAGDAIGIQASHRVWVDHVDVSSDMSHDKDYYDGLIDITHGCTGITVSYSRLHDHWKGSLVGHSDSNGSEDRAITVTYYHNYWYNINSRGPSVRFGRAHVVNNYYNNVKDGINTRQGAQVLAQNNVWRSESFPLS